MSNVIANELKSQEANLLATIQNKVQEAVEQPFQTATLTSQGRVRTMYCDAVGHLILDQIMMAVIGEKTNKHLDKHLEAGKAAEALDKRLLCRDEFLADIEWFVQSGTMNAITHQRTVHIIGSTSMATSAKKDAGVAALEQSRLMQVAGAPTRSESSGA